MKMSLTVALQLATSNLLLPSALGWGKTIRGTKKVKQSATQSSGLEIQNIMVRNQISVPLKLTEAYYFAGATTYNNDLAFQYYVNSELDYFYIKNGTNTNLKSRANNEIVIDSPSSSVPGGYSFSIADGMDPMPQKSSLTLVLEPTEYVNDLQVAVIYVTTGSDSNQVTTQFLQGTYSSGNETFWNDMENTEKCNFNGGNTNVYYNENLCGLLGGPALFTCPSSNTLGYGGQTACLPQSNTSAGFAEIIEGDLTENLGMITVDLTEVAYSNAYSNWNPVASSGTQTLSMSTSWSTSSSTQQNSTHSFSFTESVSESIKFNYGLGTATTKVGVSATQRLTESTSSTLSMTENGSTSVTCNPSPCDGILYQWNVNAEDTNGNEANTQSCDFQCVPFLSGSDFLRCPLGYCSSPTCNCCNAIWRADNQTAEANYLDSRLPGGTCEAFEVQYPIF